MKSSIGLVALLALAILAVVATVGLSGPVRVEVGPWVEPTASTAAVPSDAGSLDSLLDTVQLEHLMNHGR